MKTFQELEQWCTGAAEQFGDPSVPVCQLFLRWQDSLEALSGEDLVCSMRATDLLLQLGSGLPPLPMPICTGKPQFAPDGELTAYGAERITTGIWSITPSLNAVGFVHAFLVLYDVPEPAPWERRIVLL